ncbi:MAG: hypothetical protein HZB51_20075 [Chloroflexi bacterium]|nr:hypothetical protein [Chloroflexota bacterium]
MNADKIKYIVLCFAVLTLSCNLSQFIASAPTPTPMLIVASTPIPPATKPPTRAVQLPPPAWWDKQIQMPNGAEFIGDAKRAMWSTGDTNVDRLRDFFLRQVNAAGYESFVITQSSGAIYDLLFVKGQTAYALNLTLGSDAIIITANRVGVMRLKVSGVLNTEIDLPMRGQIDTTPGSEVSIGTSLPSEACAGCQYFINVHIAPFKGVGTYDGKPGISIIDVELVPGGDYDRDNYRWAQTCVVTVQETGGSFDCRGLQNIIDQNQKVDASGTWTQPAQ